jgi:hypothetical protein
MLVNGPFGVISGARAYAKIDGAPDDKLVRPSRKIYIHEFLLHGKSDLLKPVQKLILLSPARRVDGRVDLTDDGRFLPSNIGKLRCMLQMPIRMNAGGLNQMTRLNSMSINESWYNKLPVPESDDVDVYETLSCKGIRKEMTGDVLQHPDNVATGSNGEQASR